ncbi:DUF5683 domain-containing protein [Pedobacter sp. MW01-1-1]|uniref:DUF5683 domain-containing protein n=1 Tax=Pedobacter sp. MW01-1-1 TaxID=3383027 RepID=UPI003FF06FE8
MLQRKRLILVSLFAVFITYHAKAQVKEDTVVKTVDTIKSKNVKAIAPAKAPMSRTDSMKAAYVNPGKVAGHKAAIKSAIIPGWGQVYNMQILNDGYGTRAGKSQTWQKVYTSAKIGAIYAGFTILTINYINYTKQYNLYLKELQFRDQYGVPDPKGPFTKYSTAGITNGKDTYRRNRQIVLFSYGLVYMANIVDAYVSARLHFFNIDDDLALKVSPSAINSNNMYSFNPVPAPALKLSLTF